VVLCQEAQGQKAVQDITILCLEELTEATSSKATKIKIFFEFNV